MSKVRIPVEQLPPPNSNGDHVLQFRVISEDRNKISAWSNLYVIKSIGQYRPYESDVTVVIGTDIVDVTWDTPSIYNYNSASLTSASVLHNHSQNFKSHDADIFVKWDDDDFQYHDRVNKDNTSIIIPNGSASVRVVGLVATHGLPKKGENESDLEYNARIDEHFYELLPLFKIFDTGTQSLT